MDDYLKNVIDNFEARASNDARMVSLGVKAAENKMLPALRNLAACYRKAQKDEATKLPSYLHAAIVNCAELVKE